MLIFYRFTGYFGVEVEGQYTFCLNSDDGSRMYLKTNSAELDFTDDVPVIVFNPGTHSIRQECSSPVVLKKGKYPIRVIFFHS